MTIPDGYYGSFNPIRDKDMSVSEIDKLGSVIYFIYANGELLYVGQSVNFKVRVKEHIQRFNKEAELIGDGALTCLSFRAIGVPEEELNETERYYIEKYTPPYNLQWMPESLKNAYRDVRVAKMELAMSRMKLDYELRKYRNGSRKAV